MSSGRLTDPSSSMPSRANIYVMNADGSDQHAITHSPGGLGYYYPSGPSMERSRSGAEARRVRTAGLPTRRSIRSRDRWNGDRLTHDAVHDIEPAWSPDGSRIAYWHDGALRIMRATGRRSVRCTRGNGGAWAPAWSPDGKNIAFITYIGNLPTEKGGAPLMQLRTIDLKSEKVIKLDVHSLTTGTAAVGLGWRDPDQPIQLNRKPGGRAPRAAPPPCHSSQRNVPPWAMRSAPTSSTWRPVWSARGSGLRGGLPRRSSGIVSV
jgi:hypothetical protein